jgi:hypothetical protein
LNDGSSPLTPALSRDRRLFLSTCCYRPAQQRPKFRQITGAYLDQLNRGYGSAGAYSNITTRSRARRQPALKENLMKKTLTAFVAAATMASAIAAMPTAADARCDGCAIGAGVVGGLVAGAIIGGAVANARPAPVYVEPAPVYAAPVRTCLVDQQVWSPRYQAYVMRPVRVAC